MGDFTIFTSGETADHIKSQPRNTTLELIKQYARVYTPVTAIAFSQLIAN